jgi:hypothetical protein
MKLAFEDEMPELWNLIWLLKVTKES